MPPIAYRLSPGGEYGIPDTDRLAAARAYVECLPLVDPPGAFGLSPNADISFQRQRSDALFGTVLSLQVTG